MPSPFGPLTVIANPAAGRGRVRAQLGDIEVALRSRGLEPTVRVTSGPGDATRLAREARATGVRFVAAVGGDGTVHEVVNGLAETDGPTPVLGVIAAGSGSDLIRTFGLPSDAAEAADRLSGDATAPLDLLRVTYATGAGHATRYCANIAEVGFGAANVRRAMTLPRALGGQRYFVAFWLALPGHAVGNVRLSVDRTVAYEGRAVNVVIANCRYFGSGMHISPRSRPDDGMAEVLTFTGPKSDSFTLVGRFYKGTHLPHPNVREARGAVIEVDADRPQPVEADGEWLGTTPARFEVVPSALLLKI